MQGRNKLKTQFLGWQRTTCSQEASKNWINQTFISVEIQTIYKSIFIYEILGPRDWTRHQKVWKQGLLRGRDKFGTQFLGLHRTTGGQEASKICIDKTFISVEIQTIYKSVFIYEILGPRDWRRNQKVWKRGLLPGRNQFGTQFLALQHTSLGQEASKI